MALREAVAGLDELRSGEAGLAEAALRQANPEERLWLEASLAIDGVQGVCDTVVALTRDPDRTLQ